MKLTDRTWHRFKLCDICYINSGKDIYESERKEGELPYITSTSSNNGIKYFVSNTNKTLDEKAISVNRNGSVGFAFYHKYKALYSNDCRKLKLKKHNNEYVSLFITNQIMQQKEKYNYGYKMGTGRLLNQYIMLPVNKNSEPDYSFMKKYIKDKINNKYINYSTYSNDKIIELSYKKTKPLNEMQWKEFNLTELFDTIQRGKRLTKANQIVGTIPYISSTSLNNGINNFISNNNGRNFSNCITIANSGSVGSTFYQPYEFIASDHVTHLKSDKMNKYIYLFVSTIAKRLSGKYNFNREINDKRISREKIMLPVDNANKPNYAYMEQYIINMMLKKYKQFKKKDI